MTIPVRAVAFDFDGVIADTTTLKSELFLEMFAGVPEYSNIVQYESAHQSLPRRRKIEDILTSILKSDHSKSVDYFLQEYATALESQLPKAQLISGFENFLKELKQMQLHLYIVSSGLGAEIESYLGITRKKDFLNIYDATTSKVQALQSIIAKHGLRNEELLFLGDNLTDFEAAVAAGCRFAAINPNAKFAAEVPAFADFNSFDLQLLR